MTDGNLGTQNQVNDSADALTSWGEPVRGWQGNGCRAMEAGAQISADMRGGGCSYKRPGNGDP